MKKMKLFTLVIIMAALISIFFSNINPFSMSANTIINPTYNSSTADTTAGSVQILITSANNGNCNSVTDTITLIYTSTITISAGASQTVCSNNPVVALSGTCTTGVGTWTTSGSGTFLPNTLTGGYIPSAADISSGVVVLTVTSGNNGTCLPITSTMTINITPGPTAFAGNDLSVCANNATVALSGTVGIATYPTHASDSQSLFLAADQALFIGKEKGRNCVVVSALVAKSPTELPAKVENKNNLLKERSIQLPVTKDCICGIKLMHHLKNRINLNRKWP